ncbi:tripartite tricarboxylate transporter TctB family protein [Celeribacter sp. ULVN23_4]
MHKKNSQAMFRSLTTHLRRDRRPGDLVFAIAFMIFALTTLFLLPVQTRWVEKTVLFAQPAFWPGVGVFMMVGFGAVHLLSSVVSVRQEGRGVEMLYWLRSLEFVAWFLAYVALVPLLGYLPATIVFALLLTLRLGYRSPQSLALAALFGFAVVLVFKAGLQVKVPAGALYAYLPESIRTFVMVNF